VANKGVEVTRSGRQGWR